MSNWAQAINLYKQELLKERSRLQNELRLLRQQLNKTRASKGLILTVLNTEIRALAAKIKDHTENIEAHNNLISQTEDGTLDDPNFDSE